jgi:DNA polymerase-1
VAERCSACPYSGGAIGPRGNLSAKVVIVGEAPGADELRTGLPFVGQAGKLLSKALARAELDEDAIFVTNAMSCRPPVGTPPLREAIDACRGRLLSEVRSAPRELLILLGNSALRSITGNHNLKITNERGKVIDTEFGSALPTFHPAYILRNPGEFPRLLADFKYAGTLATGVQKKSPGETRWDLVTPENIRRVVDFLIKQPLLACDIETSGYNPRKDRILCFGVGWTKNRVAIFPEELLTGSLSGVVHQLLEAPGPRWIWHNGKFDTSWFRVGYRINARVDEDTMLMHYCLNEQRGTHDLEQLGSDYLGAPNWKSQMMAEVIKAGHLKKRSDSYALIPDKILWDYNAKDVDVTLQLFGAVTDELGQSRNAGLVPLYHQVLLPASRFLQQVEAAGVYVDLKTVNALEKSLYQDMRESLAEINSLIAPIWDPQRYQLHTGAMKPPIEFNPGSPKQVLYILREIGIRVPNTLDATLRPLAGRHQFVRALLKYKKVNKLLSTYVEGVRDHIQPDGRVHCTYLIHGTTTGRLSSRNPNMQNVPREGRIRNMFQAAPGNTLLEFDYSQVELRVLAYFSGDKFLRTVYQEGRDLHDEVALALFGPGFTQEQRVRAKFVNFGIAYGRGAKSISDEFKIPIDESAEMIRGWFRRAPEAAAYIKHCREAPVLGKTLSTPFGRRRRFGLVTKENLNTLQNEAVNFPIQSTASDLTLISALSSIAYLRQTWDAHITNLIHDSILVEVSEEADLEELSKYVISVMQEVPRFELNTELPFTVTVHTGKRWGDLKAE